MRVRLRARARRDLDGIFDYSVAHYGQEVATEYVRAIGQAFKRLADFPELGAPRPEFAPTMRSFPTREHRIYYVVTGSGVSVVLSCTSEWTQDGICDAHDMVRRHRCSRLDLLGIAGLSRSKVALFWSAVRTCAAPLGSPPMSRSRKKSPFIGFTTARSDQPWKAKAARAFRHAANQELRVDSASERLPVKRWARVNPWDAPKDGKQRIAAPDWKTLRK